MIWYLLSIASLLPWIGTLLNGRQSINRVPHMRDLPASPVADTDATIGRLSVVIAARNEAAGVEKALRSLASQTHPDYEIIIVNDRSTDTTGEIIDRLAAEFPEKIKALHITELPDGWLGKCNALHTGGEAATGEYILFTDADVEFQQTVLERSHRYALREDADQFAVFSEMVAASFWEKAMVNVFAICFTLYFPPYKATVRNSGHFVGIGAFNMVRTSMYRKIQGHRFLRLQVVDDMGLGKLIKFSGGTVRVAWGLDFVKVRWQISLMETIRGLEKNFFASTNYSIIRTAVMVLGTLVMFVWPWVGVWIGSPGARWVAGAALLMQIIVSALAARQARFSAIHGVTSQFGGILLVVAMVRSAWITLRRGGITWRDSFYPLKDLKEFRL